MGMPRSTQARMAITLMLTPLLLPPLREVVPDLPPDRLLHLIATETLIGALIGLMGRLFFLALQFMATAAAQFVGLSAPAAPAVTTACAT